MAYEVNKSNGDAIIVQDNTLNVDTSLKLVGKNFPGYGEYIGENFVHLLENFACATPPSNPTPGQLWYNSVTDTWSYYTSGLEWKYMGMASAKPLLVKDNDINVADHLVTAFYDQDDIVSIVSSDDTFAVRSDDPVFSTFPVVGKGITLATGAKLHGTATSAEYADLAEMYTADDMYEPGTVVKLGGAAEVTATAGPNCSDVFGIVSTDPAYLMNSKSPGVAVALAGRVPCKVWGSCKKGDRLISSGVPGVAMSAHGSTIDWTQQVGRALEDKDTVEVGLVEVVVGAR